MHCRVPARPRPSPGKAPSTPNGRGWSCLGLPLGRSGGQARHTAWAWPSSCRNHGPLGRGGGRLALGVGLLRAGPQGRAV